MPMPLLTFMHPRPAVLLEAVKAPTAASRSGLHQSKETHRKLPEVVILETARLSLRLVAVEVAVEVEARSLVISSRL